MIQFLKHYCFRISFGRKLKMSLHITKHSQFQYTHKEGTVITEYNYIQIFLLTYFRDASSDKILSSHKTGKKINEKAQS